MTQAFQSQSQLALGDKKIKIYTATMLELVALSYARLYKVSELQDPLQDVPIFEETKNPHSFV